MKPAYIDTPSAFDRLTGQDLTNPFSLQRERLKVWKVIDYSREMLDGYVVEGRLISVQLGLKLKIPQSSRLCRSETQLRLVEALVIHGSSCIQRYMPVDFTVNQLVQIVCDRYQIDRVNNNPIDAFRDAFFDRDKKPASRFSLGIVEYTGRSGRGNLPSTPSRLEPTGLIDLIDPSDAAHYREEEWGRCYVKNLTRPHTPPPDPPFDPDGLSDNEIALRSNGFGSILVPSNDLDFDSDAYL